MKVYKCALFSFIFLFLVGCSHNNNINMLNRMDVYAEGYYFNQTNPVTISIAATNVTYNITGFIQSDVNNMVFEGDGVTVLQPGLYQLTGSVSFDGGNGGIYGFGMTIDGVPQRDCGMSKGATNVINNVGLTCLKYLYPGDHLNLVVRDANNPSQDVYIYRMNVNIVRLG